MAKVDEGDNGREIALAQGEQLEVWLSENRTTGYKWEIRSSGSPACALMHETVQPGATFPGAGGRHGWVFQAAAPGSAIVELVYQRPWEENVPAARSFHIAVTVASRAPQD